MQWMKSWIRVMISKSDAEAMVTLPLSRSACSSLYSRRQAGAMKMTDMPLVIFHLLTCIGGGLSLVVNGTVWRLRTGST